MTGKRDDKDRRVWAAVYDAKTVRAAERIVTATLRAAVEAGRKACEEIARLAKAGSAKAEYPYDGGVGSLGYERACRDIADAIAARGEKAEPDK